MDASCYHDDEILRPAPGQRQCRNKEEEDIQQHVTDYLRPAAPIRLRYLEREDAVHSERVNQIRCDRMEANSKSLSKRCRRGPFRRDERSMRFAQNVRTFDPVDGWIHVLDLTGHFAGNADHHRVVCDEL